MPTITLDGDSDGVAPATDGTSYAKKFSGKGTHRIIKASVTICLKKTGRVNLLRATGPAVLH